MSEDSKKCWTITIKTATDGVCGQARLPRRKLAQAKPRQFGRYHIKQQRQWMNRSQNARHCTGWYYTEACTDRLISRASSSSCRRRQADQWNGEPVTEQRRNPISAVTVTMRRPPLPAVLSIRWQTYRIRTAGMWTDFSHILRAPVFALGLKKLISKISRWLLHNFQPD